MEEELLQINQSLKGTRIVNGELRIKDFTPEDYETLYFYILEVLKPYFNGNYENWYFKTVKQYVRFKKKTNRTYDFYVSQDNKPIELQTVQEQLAVFKFFIYRRTGSKYPKKTGGTN